MSETVDARGYLCPQPVMMLVKQMKARGEGQFDILVDNETSRENVRRTAEGRSWTVIEDVEVEDYFKISVSKQA